MAGRKRARSGADAAADAAVGSEAGPSGRPANGNVPTANGQQQQQQQQQQQDGPDRRLGMADAARRRAAHFAHFQGEADGQADNVHTGSNQARTLGPWSSAKALVEARDQARTQREQQAQHAHEEEQEAINWEPSPSQAQQRRWKGSAPPSVPTLFAACLNVLNEYVDCIDSLLGVPDSIKVKLATHVCGRRKLDAKTAQLFADGEPSEVVLPDCHQLDAAAMTSLIQGCATPRLEVLELGSCGRGFGDAQTELLRQAGPLPLLTSLKLGGAYRLTDAGLKAALSAGPNITSLALPHCSYISGASLHRLPTLCHTLRRLDLQDCRGVECEALAAVLPALKTLVRLGLDGMHAVDDAVVRVAAEQLPCLEDLAISYTQVTDIGLGVLAQHRGHDLRSLALDECSHVTDAGIRALAQRCGGLRRLSVRRCAKLSDEALAAVAAQGALQRLVVSGVTGFGNKSLQALALHCKECLEYLDVSFCRNFSERALGLVADKCHRLSYVLLLGCSQVTRLFLDGHSNSGLRVDGVGTVY